MKPGDEIEFWSGDGGGRWKYGVVVDVMRYGNHLGVKCNLRIMTGPGVTIIRPSEKCRMRGAVLTSNAS